MKQFKFPLSISGSSDELKNLRSQLIKLGYRDVGYKFEHDHKYLITEFLRNEPDSMGFNQTEGFGALTKVSASNPELVLALATCVEDDEFYEGEWVKMLTDYAGSLETGGLYKLLKPQFMGDRKSYWTVNHASHSYLSPLPNRDFIKATKEEILNHFNNMKKIIGYKLKEDCKEYAVAACKIEGYISMGESIKNCHPIPLDEAYRTDRRVGFDKLKKAGVLDLWFEPVYEEQKKVITLTHGDYGFFDIEVSKDGIYYAQEDTFLNVADLRKAVGGIDVAKKKGNSNGEYHFKPTHLDSGCKKGVPVEDWIKVLNAYDEIKSK